MRKKITVLLIIGVPIFILFLILNTLWGFYKTIYQPNKITLIKQESKPVEKFTYNFLLLGYGGGNHDGTYLTDTLMVLHLDLKKKKTSLISIPRDTWVKVPTKSGKLFSEKINAIYQMELFPKNYPDIDSNFKKTNDLTVMKRVTKQITNLDIDNYFTIDFDGFIKAIDVLGDIQITVEKTFDDYEYPVDGKEKDLCGKEEKDLPELEKIATESPTLAFPCRYEKLHFDAGTQTMNGTTALKYVRSRHSLQDGTDFGRARRQQLFIEAVKKKIFTITFIPKIIPLLDKLKDNITTDISPQLLQKLLTEAPNAGQYTSNNLVLSNSNYLTNGTASTGAFILLPKTGEGNWTEIQMWIANSLAGITPTPVATTSSTLIPTVSKKIQ